jgi:hypothetical protein
MIDQHRDNSTIDLKAQLRTRTLLEIKNPVVMETHGGLGKIYQRCYRHVKQGVVFEMDPAKSGVLALQRPSWAVYEVNCIRALALGVGAHLEVNFLDLDPYGEPWDVMDAYFNSSRPFPPRMALVVNDGLRQKLKMGAGWAGKSMQEIVTRVGNNALYHDYLTVCRDLVAEKSGRAGYELKAWTAYYCGGGASMTHYAAILEKA